MIRCFPHGTGTTVAGLQLDKSSASLVRIALEDARFNERTVDEATALETSQS
jgi:hypothetical protein